MNSPAKNVERSQNTLSSLAMMNLSLGVEIVEAIPSREF